MTRSLAPLSLSLLEELPERCRNCVSWEVPVAAAIGMDAAQAGFEKEVWLSGVMLTWGTAGQIVRIDGRPVGFALYAPPTAVPGAGAFPTSPVSPDAVLLTRARIIPEFAGQGLGRFLLAGVIGELTRRGVRAVELFARVGDDDQPAPPTAGRRKRLRPARSTTTGASVPDCMLPAGFALAMGFQIVAPHHRFPRLRFELTGGIGWKAEVERALSSRLRSGSVSASPAPHGVLVGAGSTGPGSPGPGSIGPGSSGCCSGGADPPAGSAL